MMRWMAVGEVEAMEPVPNSATSLPLTVEFMSLAFPDFTSISNFSHSYSSKMQRIDLSILISHSSILTLQLLIFDFSMLFLWWVA